MAKHVVTFVGQNENGILRELNSGLMRSLEPTGLIGHVIDLYDPNWAKRFEQLAREGILAAWGSAGIGSALKSNGKNLWDELKIPFVSALADPPCWLPQAHRPESRFVVLGYLFDEWLDIQRRIIRAPQIYGRLPTCIPPNPHRDRVPWVKRSHRMVFIKTGDSPVARRANWQKLPSKLRSVLEDCATQACRHETMGLTDLLLSCLDARGLFLDSRTDILFTLMRELDLYVRAERSTRMAEALCSLPVDIIGRGWDHVSRDRAKAKFYPAVDAVHLSELMANTQFVVNTTPNFGSGVHERVLAGFAARACVVSDHNKFSRTAFANVPTFFGLEWQANNLADQIAQIWSDRTDRGPDTEAAIRMTETIFAPKKFMDALLELSATVLV